MCLDWMFLRVRLKKEAGKTVYICNGSTFERVEVESHLQILHRNTETVGTDWI